MVVFTQNIRAAFVRGREKLIAKNLFDLSAQLIPFLFPGLINIEKKIPQDISGLPLANEQVLIGPVVMSLFRANAGERWNMDNLVSADGLMDWFNGRFSRRQAERSRYV